MIRFLSRISAFVLLAYVLGYATFAALLPRAAGDERTDAIVVLTGGTGRLDRGFELLRAQRAGRMLISGVDRRVRSTELAAAYRVDERLLDCCVTLGREAFDTRSNADEAVRWMERNRFTSMRLVTNDLHMPRARYEMRKRVGKEVTIVTDAVSTDPSFQQIFTEYNKYLLGRVADMIGI